MSTIPIMKNDNYDHSDHYDHYDIHRCITPAEISRSAYRSRRIRTASLRFLAVAFLFVQIITPSAGQPATTALAQSRQIVAHLRFANHEQARAGKLILDIDPMPEAPSGYHYELWLKSRAESVLSLGKLPVKDGQVHFSSMQNENLLEAYSTILISLEANDTKVETVSAQVVMTADLAKAAFGPLQSFFAPNTQQGKGLLLGAAEQLQIALNHSGYLQAALADGEREMVRSHAEHVINILNGKLGELYGDLNQNDNIENPGDGVGLIGYLQEIEQKLDDLGPSLVISPSITTTVASSPTLSNTARSSRTRSENADHDLLQITLEDVRQSQSDASAATELVARILSQDTIEEVIQAGNFEQASAILDQMNSRLLSAYELALSNVTFVFYADQFVALEDLPPIIATSATDSGNGNQLTASSIPPFISQPANPQAGDVWQNPVDETAFVYIAGGEFTMGADKEQTTFSKERPAHSQQGQGFWLKVSEVTNQQFATCVETGTCTAPDNELWQKAENGDFPVTHVTWEQASIYANWSGGRLPSEAEWEHACRTPDNRIYAWGNQDPDEQRANFNRAAAGVNEVGTATSGASATGLLDLSGNVGEWTSSLDMPYPYDADDGREDPDNEGRRIARGGSFVYSQFQLRCFSRLAVKASSTNRDLGFRVLIDVEPRLWQNPVDGAAYTYINGGRFTMGADMGQTTFAKERPAHNQEIEDGYWLKVSEVTNQQYAACVAAGDCSAPNNKVWQELVYADFPVTHITWEQAATYARWVGGRLPSEAEWEHACRANDDRIYPWGNQDPDAQHANFDNSAAGASKIGSFPDGAGVNGLLDLSGNVGEWTSSLEMPYPYDRDDGREDAEAEAKRIARGGSFVYSQFQLRCFSRLAVKSTSTNRDLGFRVLIDASQPQ